MTRSPKSCPIASKFIDTLDDAAAYYQWKLAGDHVVDVQGVRVVIRFPIEENHAYTDSKCPAPWDHENHKVVRASARREERCFSRDRARLMDEILETVGAPATCHKAKSPGAVQIFGPAKKDARRMSIVLVPEKGCQATWIVRTAYPIAARDFAQACRNKPMPAPWPPKKESPGA